MAAEDLEWERSKISHQDLNLMKKLGLTKTKDALRFPSDESYPSPPISYRLHQLTPNSILHIVIFITLCECFLGVPPNWALWKRIFYLRRNGSHNFTYNIGGVVICVRPDVEYFDVKFPDSVQGWRKRWLYVREESANSVEYNIAPFDGSAKILRRRSWDAEATEEEKASTEALMSRIHELQNTRGRNCRLLFLLFLKMGKSKNRPLSLTTTRVLLALRVKSRVLRNPRLLLKEKILRLPHRHSLPSAVSPRNKRKRDEVDDSGTSKTGAPPAEEVVPTEERTTFNPYEDALVSSGDEDENPPTDATARGSTSQTLVVSEAQPDEEETSPPQQDVELTAPIESPRASSPKRARVEPAKEPSQLIGSSTTPSLDDPLMQEFLRLGTQFIGYRDHCKELEANLAEANKRADALALQSEQSENARKKAESNAAVIEDLRKRLHSAENSLSENNTQQTAREEGIISRLESQSRRFVRRTQQDYDLENPDGDRLLDALSLLEIHGDEARQGLTDARTVLSRLFPFHFAKKEEPESFTALAQCFMSKEDLGPSLRQEGLKIGVEGTIALVANSHQNVDWAKVGDVKDMETKKWQSLIKAAKPNSKKILSFLGFKPTPAPSSSKPEVK
ncbi:hypothetical protein QYE76_059793 [Lolium multiflorum]|uniref:Transposase (putative) gypsy type domain-containing protein n=1 Tax=Lolium multiflorum TaxID=4521 RepID=A0AAD8W3N3_LOLMU|nr:hypothetical protein QYE76_059793 [Lolium multiflorum]